MSFRSIPTGGDALRDLLREMLHRLRKIEEGGLFVGMWHVIGGASEPAFQHSWVNAGGSLQTAAFRRDPLGRVSLRGVVKSGTPAAIFTLPAGYRPTSDERFSVEAGTSDAFNGHARLDVLASGDVTIVIYSANGTNGAVSLSGISFSVV